MVLFELTMLGLVTILIALLFDFFNGVNDAANSIATVVATRVLNPAQAVVLAAVFNFVGPFTLGTAVAKTVATGIVRPDWQTTELVLAGLVGAIAWTWIATTYGVPISVSHSLVGGLVGAGLAVAGAAALELPSSAIVAPIFRAMAVGALGGAVVGLVLGLVTRPAYAPVSAFLAAFAGSGLWLSLQIALGTVTVEKLFSVFLFIFYAPLLGFIGGFLLNLLLIWAFQRATPGLVSRVFGKLQIVSASFFSLGHGTNDAQKTMGVITVVLVAEGFLADFAVPTWVIIVSASAIALGTAVGGYKVVHTMGMKLTHLEPHQGFSAETAGASSLTFLAALGVPVSTTHVIAGSIMGVGSVRGGRHVNWDTARTLVVAWVLTIPAAAMVGFIVYELLHAVLGVI